MSTGVIIITDTEFETEVLKSEQPVLVYFWAAWCGPCKLMAPVLNTAANNYGDRLKIVKMEVDPNPVAVKEYQIEGVPAFRLVRDGQLLAATEGAIGKEKLLDFIEANLN
ncbi:thioredoxin family protein [Brunnivagina elsteri]|uniref:Thioredoxin n=1 Tax=Brunnivagina elsteri CCALA 953 TaxID=987040 RepID=A0A2A2TL60_9CYAN|nr:thioredoxin family protein [Calothrix elsteri]PAX57231.1 thiol reductase thioredoxin [Calothrix elsteri CCALA 953]